MRTKNKNDYSQDYRVILKDSVLQFKDYRVRREIILQVSESVTESQIQKGKLDYWYKYRDSLQIRVMITDLESQIQDHSVRIMNLGLHVQDHKLRK